MAEATKQRQNEEKAKQKKSTKQREQIQNAYAALIGDQNNQTFYAFTLEEAVDAQIERLSGASTKLRPNQIDRVTRIKEQLLKTVEQVREIPPSEFILRRGEGDVNTRPSGE